MSTAFDPYYKWLAIPPGDQPPNHYRLLAIPLYTDDADVISHAADQRMAHVRSFQVGDHSAASQRILNELANARLCLLNPNERESYDAELKRITVVPTAIPVATPLPPPADESLAAPPLVEESHEHASKSRRKPQKALGLVEAAKIIAGSVAGLAIGYLILCMIGPQYDFLGVMAQSTETSSDASANTPDEPANDDAEEPSATTVSDPFDYVDEPRTVRVAKVEDHEPSSVGDEGDDSEVPSVREPVETDDERLSRLSAERDEAIEKGQLAVALTKVKELADLASGDAFEMQAELVLSEDDSAEPNITAQMRADALITIMDSAIAADRTAFAKNHQDDLLKLTRESGDADLIRRGTLTVLKIQAMKSGE